MLKTILAAATIFALSACATAGTKVSADQLAQLHKGQTTITQTIQILGKPQSQAAYAGNTMLYYVHTASSMDAVSFVPVVGAFAGTQTHDTDMLTLTFDPAGVLADIGSSASSISAGGPLSSR